MMEGPKVFAGPDGVCCGRFGEKSLKAGGYHIPEGGVTRLGTGPGNPVSFAEALNSDDGSWHKG